MRNVRVVASVLLRPLQFVAYAIARLWPRNPDRWVFGCWSGRRFGDNAAALFLEVAADDAGPRATWITTRRAIKSELSERGFDARLRWSPAGLWASLRAGVYLYDGYTKDINHWTSPGAITVLLRHGVGMKRADRGIDVPTHRLYRLFHGSLRQRLFWRAVLPWHAVRPDIALATSDEHARQAVEYFGTPRERVLITGFPRHDALLAPRAGPVPPDVARIRSEQAPVFLFMPTFRDGFSRHDFDWDGLERAAAEAGTVLYVKLHFVDSDRGTAGSSPWGERAALRMVDPTIDPITLYPEVHGLVTDFSSAAFDFMLLRKPIVYFVPDYDEFLSVRSLYYPFEEVTPGDKCRTLDELMEALRRAVTDGIGAHADHFDQLLPRFYAHTDGRSSRRAFEAIRAAIARTGGRAPAAPT
jgi:CDP-glycerol glycerophosphotransferase (TagB/SpsB family)